MASRLADPRVRRDGRCIVCSKPRKPERSKTYGKGQAEIDPFCSTECCRLWHDTPIPYKRGTISIK